MAASLTACTTPQQRAERLEKEYGPICEERGVKKGDPAYDECINSLYSRDMLKRRSISGGLRR
jgi:hypothetical protein